MLSQISHTPKVKCHGFSLMWTIDSNIYIYINSNRRKTKYYMFSLKEFRFNFVPSDTYDKRALLGNMGGGGPGSSWGGMSRVQRHQCMNASQ